MPKTQLKKLFVEKFRALSNVEIEFGDHITVVCGKNGTSKSSILGIAAQIFNFEKDYEKNKSLAFQQITGKSFDSKYREHFRVSEKFDTPGSMQINVEVHDGYSNTDATASLEFMTRSGAPARAVVRNNSTAEKGSNESRKFTHPVIFLSLKRLYPIADRNYKTINFDYFVKHKSDFIGLTNELLNRQSLMATSTGGTISSAVAHGENYDQDSVSAGEDNAGQIILALMSFRKLKEEYPDYKGGLLLIDEADAGLFPTAQVNLLKILDRECKELNLQVVMTSHSPTLIEYAYQQSQQYRRKYKTIYLSNTFGGVQVMHDWSWPQISADIHTRTVSTSDEVRLPPVNVYFEDKEAADFFAALMNRQPIKKFTRPLPEISLGCSNYLQLIQKGVSEFSEKSVVCLDSDTSDKVKGKNYKTVVLLPGTLPPDQLIFEYLYNLSPHHEYWINDLQFTRDVFTNTANEVIRAFSISGSNVDISSKVLEYMSSLAENDKEKKKKVREIFKRFYNSPVFQRLVSTLSKPYNPWLHWVKNNPAASNQFLEQFKAALHHAMKVGYSVDAAKLTALDIKLKKVI